MRHDIITIGGVTEDIMFHTGEAQIIKNPKKTGSRYLFAFEAGGKILADQEVLYTGGGGGANTAISFSRLGLKTALVASIGRDLSGQRLFTRLKKEKVNLNNLQILDKRWTGISFIITAGKRNERIIFTDRAANDQFKINKAIFRKLKAGWYYLTSLSGDHWRDNLDFIFQTAQKKKTPVAWNPGSLQLKAGLNFLKKYLKQTEVLILNKEEAMELAGSKRKNVKAEVLFKDLSKLGPKIISITDGVKGAYVYQNNEQLFAKAIGNKPVNKTGAGDAFGSSLVGGFILYNDLERALRLAIIRSGFVVMKIGAQEGLLTRSQAEDKINLA